MESHAATTLYTLLATYANTAALKDGQVTSPLIDFKFADVKVANTAFKRLVREAEFDAGELAIVTYLQAKVAGKPYSLLPAVIVGRGQHHTIAYNPEKGELHPSELDGKRVGVRSYTQTTGAWVCAILQEEHGVDSRKVYWITFEAPHIAEYADPEWVERAPADKQLVQMLLDGEIDAAIVGNELPDSRLRHLIPDHEAAAKRWAETYGPPINHMLVVRNSIVASQPELVKELFRMFAESKHLGAGKINEAALPFGVETNRKALDQHRRHRRPATFGLAQAEERRIQGADGSHLRIPRARRSHLLRSAASRVGSQGTRTSRNDSLIVEGTQNQCSLSSARRSAAAYGEASPLTACSVARAVRSEPAAFSC